MSADIYTRERKCDRGGRMGFPYGDYTPFGCLANPFHIARSWEETSGGNLRSTDDLVGFAWEYPTSRRPQAKVGLGVALSVKDRDYLSRGDFELLGYRSCHHSSQVFSYNWSLDHVDMTAFFFLAEQGVLAARISVYNRGVFAKPFTLFLVASVAGSVGGAECRTGDGCVLLDVPAAGRESGHILACHPMEDMLPIGPTGDLPSLSALSTGAEGLRAAPADRDFFFAYRIELVLAPGEARTFTAGLAKTPAGSRDLPAWRGGLLEKTVLAWENTLERLLAEDDDFWQSCPRLSGDWPATWKNGWVYDLETTRMCLMPARGIFRDVWPTWMINYPRAVLAEGTMDMARLSLAAPELACRAVLSLFRDTPGANVPCVFEGGEPNMVAKDGNVCGTSPAWCMPFYNVHLIYVRTLDRSWLAELYPHLVVYVEWWLANRTDEEGWLVYKCTWEAGEDNTPRLDPNCEGDNVISAYVRPVELQATMAHAAEILAFFASELGYAEDAARWQDLCADFTNKTWRLWDEAEGRFRDWDKRSSSFIATKSAGEYWGADPCRFSPLSLAPVALGIATPGQTRAMAREIGFYDASPWCDWPSWSYVVLEAAMSARLGKFAGDMAFRILDRVYRNNDRRHLSIKRPTPGVSPEYWPTDLGTFGGSDGYSWGANTMSLLVRYIFGFCESDATEYCEFFLYPNFAMNLFRNGGHYGLENLPYRGARLRLSYNLRAEGMTAEVQLEEPMKISVVGDDGTQIYLARREATSHVFAVANHCRYKVRLNV